MRTAPRVVVVMRFWYVAVVDIICVERTHVMNLHKTEETHTHTHISLVTITNSFQTLPPQERDASARTHAIYVQEYAIKHNSRAAAAATAAVRPECGDTHKTYA